MKLIVGLGNIGRQYKDTPHNAGFEFLNTLRSDLERKGYTVDPWKNENMFLSEVCKVRKNNEIVFLLAKPTTYMNLSGDAVFKLVSKYSPTEVVIVHDDLDIKLGEYKVQVGKAPKDHNGVNSVQKVKGSENFLRVRIGVEGRENKSQIPGDIYVIKRMSGDQTETLNEVIVDSLKDLYQELNLE